MPTTLELHTLPPAWSLPTFTPFGLKLMAYLGLARIPFRTVVERNPRRAPKGKLPWIVDGDRVVADSGFVVSYLEARHGDPVDGWLRADQRPVAHAARRMIEESLCFSILYFRWADERIFRAATAELFRDVPPAPRWLLARLVRKRILRDLWGQGVGRHAPHEVAELGRHDLDALAALLGDRPYLMGERPCSLDASAAGFLSVLLRVPLGGELADHARAHDNLVAYERRMASQLLPHSR